MLCHGGAPIWTALTVKTGEITGISFSTGKVGPGPIRTLSPEIDKCVPIRVLIWVLVCVLAGPPGGRRHRYTIDYDDVT